MQARPAKKPQGQITRGKTASNRLRRADNFILLYEPSLLTRTDGLFADALFVDLGYGFDPRTTLESVERFRRINPNLKILGVEIDKERVEAALPFAPYGSISVANVVRRETGSGWKFEALVFGTNFHTGFDITDFRAVLPKNHIHHASAGEDMYDFFAAWKRSAAEASPAKAFGLKRWFAASAEKSALKGFTMDLHRKWLHKRLANLASLILEQGRRL